MKNHKILLFVLLFVFAIPDCKAGEVDSLTASVAQQRDNNTEVAESRSHSECYPICDTNVLLEDESVSYDVDKNNKGLDDYLAEQNKQYEQHDGNMSIFLFVMGSVLILLMAVLGIVIPLYMNRKRKKKLKNMEKMVMAAEDAARATNFSELVIRAWNEKDINLATQLIKAHPDDALTSFAYFVRGTIYGCNKNYNIAIEDLTKSINTINVESKYDTYRRCEEEYKKAIKESFNIIDAYNNRGKAYKKLNDYSRAIKDFEIVIKNDPKNLEAYDNLAYSYEQQGDNKRALDLYTEAINRNPDNPDAYIYRGDYYCQRRFGFDKAIVDYDKAVQINPNYYKAYERRGYAKEMTRDFEGAIEDYTEMIRLRPDDADAYYNRGAVYVKMGENEKAIEDYTETIRLRPDDAKAYYNRGLTFYKMGVDFGAELDYKDAIRLKPDYVEAYNNLAETLCDLKEYTKAILYANKAIDLDPDKGYIYDTRCKVYIGLEQWDKAMHDAQKGLEFAKRDNDTETIELLEKKIAQIDGSLIGQKRRTSYQSYKEENRHN